MNHGSCRIQQNATASAEEMRSSIPFANMTGDRRQCVVVCPKPRRLAFLNSPTNGNGYTPPSYHRYYYSYEAEFSDSRPASALLDIILSKGGEKSSSTQPASSPPFFSGSPPSRVSNPLIQDARFGDDVLSPPVLANSPAQSPSGSASSPASASRKGGCVRASFGSKPAVRIEGFDCLDRRDRRNCSIPALA
ncbi:hypothetical protein Dimus_014703 [Dionaea muscipula]